MEIELGCWGAGGAWGAFYIYGEGDTPFYELSENAPQRTPHPHCVSFCEYYLSPGKYRMERHILEADTTGYEPLRGFDGYRVNCAKGTIINARGWKLGTTQNAGYLICSVGGRVWLNHRLIYTHRHGTIPEKMVIDHKDDNKQNNSIDNLQAITHSANTKKAWEKIDPASVSCVPRRVVAVRLTDNQETSYASIRKAIVDLGVAGTSIRYCLAGKTKTAYSPLKLCRYAFKLPPAETPAVIT